MVGLDFFLTIIRKIPWDLGQYNKKTYFLYVNIICFHILFYINYIDDMNK